MTHKKNILLLASTLLVFMLNISSFSQSREKAAHYININHIEVGTVYDISDLKLHLEYHDAYGTAKEFLFKIYDWKRGVVANLRMDKSFGLNHYSIRLEEMFSGWEMDKIYMGEFKDEGGTLYKIPIRIVVPPVLKGPDVSIMVNPLQVSCKGLSQNLVEFYGTINGGKAPYTVNWFVLNSSRTDFLYQPKEEIILLAGKTPLIVVDKTPEYYVVLHVKDACGGEQKKIVNMVCENNRKKINTIFVEELGTPMLKHKKIQ